MPGSLTTLACAFSLVLPLGCPVPLAAGEAVPVEGDAKLLALLRQRQRSNRTSFPHGRMTVTFENKSAMVGPDYEGQTAFMVTAGAGTFEWSGDSWRYDGTRKIEMPDGKGGGTIRVTAVKDGGRILFFHRTDGAVTVRESEPAGSERILNFHPAKWSGDHDDMLQRLGGTSGKEYFPVVRRVEVRRDGDLVHVDLHKEHESEQWRSRITGSLRNGGNVVAFDDDDGGAGAGESSRSGAFRWSDKGQGTFVLDRRVEKETLEYKGRTFESVTTLDLSEHDLDHKPSRRRFTLAGLEPESAVRVDDRIAGRSYSYGRGGSQPSDAERMRILGEKLRQGGFGKGDR